MPGWLIDHKRAVDLSAGIAASIVIGRTLLLAIPEPVAWFAEMGELFYNFSLSWVTAWAFQLLVIVLPEKRKTAQFQRLVAPRLDPLIGLGLELDAALRQAADARRPSDLQVDAELLGRVCARVRLKEDAPGWMATWETVLRQHGVQAERYRAGLRPFFGQLPPEMLVALHQEELAMDQLLRVLRIAVELEDTDMARLEELMFRWLTSLHMLQEVRLTTFAVDVPLPVRPPDDGRVNIPVEQFLAQRRSMREFLDGLD